MAWELYSCDLGISACQGLSWLKTHSDLDLDFSHGQTRILPWEYVHAISNQSEVCEELLYLQANDLHLDFKVTIKLLYHKNDIWSFNLREKKKFGPDQSPRTPISSGYCLSCENFWNIAKFSWTYLPFLYPETHLDQPALWQTGWMGLLIAGNTSANIAPPWGPCPPGKLRLKLKEWNILHSIQNTRETIHQSFQLKINHK